MNRGTSIFAAAGLLLTACAGSPEVPDLIGMRYGDAASEIRDLGYEVVRDEQLPDDPSVASGDVIAQNPQPGEVPDGPVTITAARLATINGTMLLRDNERRDDGASCRGTGGYRDIQPGAQVTVTDGGGNVLGVGQLGPGSAVGARDVGSITLANCMFEFEVRDIPAADFYGVEVTRRGQLRYSRDDLESRGWQVDVTLG